MENRQQNIQEDTIDLRELFAVLRKRKKLIWSIATILTLLAIVYAFFIAKPLYEIQSTIELAQIGNKPLQNANDLKQKLETVFEVNVKGRKIIYPIVKSVDLPKKTKNIMIIKTQGRDNNSSFKKLESIVKNLVSAQNKELNNYIHTQEKKLSLNKENISQVQAMNTNNKKIIENYQNKLLQISKEDAALAGIYSIEISRKQAEINEFTDKIFVLKNTINDIELSLSPSNIKTPRSIGEALILDHPIKPKKKLIVVVAFITGLILSVFLAFFLEFISGMKKEEDEQK